MCSLSHPKLWHQKCFSHLRTRSENPKPAPKTKPRPYLGIGELFIAQEGGQGVSWAQPPVGNVLWSDEGKEIPQVGQQTFGITLRIPLWRHCGYGDREGRGVGGGGKEEFRVGERRNLEPGERRNEDFRAGGRRKWGRMEPTLLSEVPRERLRASRSRKVWLDIEIRDRK